MTAKPRTLQPLAGFTPEQTAQIAAWLQDHSHRKTLALIQERFGRPISYGALQRFARHLEPFEVGRPRGKGTQGRGHGQDITRICNIQTGSAMFHGKAAACALQGFANSYSALGEFWTLYQTNGMTP